MTGWFRAHRYGPWHRLTAEGRAVCGLQPAPTAPNAVARPWGQRECRYCQWQTVKWRTPPSAGQTTYTKGEVCD